MVSSHGQPPIGEGGLGEYREEGAGSWERGRAGLCAQPRGDRHVTLLPSSFLADTPGDGISAPLRRRCRGRRRRGWRGGLLARPDALFPGGGRGVFRGSRDQEGRVLGTPGLGFPGSSRDMATALLRKVVSAVGSLLHLGGLPLSSLAPCPPRACRQVGAPFSPAAALLSARPALGMQQPALGFKTRGVLRKRCKGCYLVKRRGRWFVYCKSNPKHKQRQM
ncbi:PREDICTED: uncharacterized protein LOC103068796 [Lipotes vexillifer]|uniref:Ribosomal protein n=1 Tax=Lipotes vexillifer TaxID=118797 RepID=A0A340YE73_LIPVE|nr:PREDICTED: uncharacterized protein LOC103068796 [Lipotes vexillifer]